MCYAKPGPRCAAHLTKHIAELEKRIENNKTDLLTKTSDQTKLAILKHEFYGTRKGQLVLDALIKEADLESQKVFVEYKKGTRRDYEKKLALYQEAKTARKTTAEIAKKAKVALTQKEKELKEQLALLRKEMNGLNSASEKELTTLIRETNTPTVQTANSYSYRGKGLGKWG